MTQGNTQIKQYTVLEQLRDERKWLLDRLSVIKRRIASLERGEVMDVPATASTAGDPAAWMKASTATVAR